MKHREKKTLKKKLNSWMWREDSKKEEIMAKYFLKFMNTIAHRKNAE